MRTKKMWEMTWPEVQEAIDNEMGVMLPVGAIEQHGCHLPLVTDTIIPTRLCTEIAENTNMIVAAPVSYGTYSRPQSGGGQGFVGTTSVTGITLVHQVEDILREFLRQGFKKIVIFNWHMENSNFLYEAAYRATERGTRSDVKVVVMETPFDSFDDETMAVLYPDGFPGWGLEHAAMFETAILLHIAPELVHMERAVDGEVEDKVFYDVLPIEPRFTTSSGSLWKSTLATKEKGACAWNALLNTLIPIIRKEFE